MRQIKQKNNVFNSKSPLKQTQLPRATLVMIKMKKSALLKRNSNLAPTSFVQRDGQAPSN